VKTIQTAEELGIDCEIKKVDFKKVMERMRNTISADINKIREGLVHSKHVDYYPESAEFVSPYTLRVGKETITAKMIILGTGSKPLIPPIKGLDKTGYLTSDSVLKMTELPKTLVIVGGGYVGAEYGHFFSSMGTKVTIIGRLPEFISTEEPEVSALVKRELGKHVKIYTSYEVRETKLTSQGKKSVVAVNLETNEKLEVTTDEILLAAGRSSLYNVLHPDKAGIKTDRHGWIVVNEYLESSQPNVWALGDANGQYPFKHVANHEAAVVYYNAVLNKNVKVDYHAVPHAVFTHPEIGAVGLGEKEAANKYGKDKILIGFYRYADTAKGEAMNEKNGFVKVIVDRDTLKILGAHIVGPYASVLIHEIIPLMYTPKQSAKPLLDSMHIHPALNEVVERAFRSLMPPEHYHHILSHYNLS
jgi:dihydrolipoamide dehydrogenase